MMVCSGSHLCVFLHVEGVHLVQNEGDGVLSDEPYLLLEGGDLFLLGTKAC